MGRMLWFSALLCGLLAGCGKTAPEQALAEAMSALQAALERRDASAVEDWLADDFVGPRGMDREGARRLAALAFLRHRHVSVTTGPLDLTVQQGHATVRFTAALTGGSARVLPDSARLYEVVTGWRLEGGEWRLTSADWSPRLQGSLQFSARASMAAPPAAHRRGSSGLPRPASA